MADEQWWKEFMQREQEHMATAARRESTDGAQQAGLAGEDAADAELRLFFTAATPADEGMARLMSGYAEFESIIAAGGTPPYHDLNPGSPGTPEFETARVAVVLSAMKEVVDLSRQFGVALDAAEYLEKECTAIEQMIETQNQEEYACALARSLARVNVYCGFFHPMELLQTGQRHLQLLVAVGNLRSAGERLRTEVLAQRESRRK